MGENTFTLRELLGLLAALVPIALFLPVITTVARMMRYESGNRSNIIGLLKAGVIYAGDNKEYFPGRTANGEFQTTALVAAPGQWGAGPAAAGPQGEGATVHSLNDYACASMLNDGGVDPRTLLDPVEFDPRIREVDRKGHVTLRTTDGKNGHGHYSYAMLDYAAPDRSLRAEWKDNSRSNAILFAERFVGTPGQPATYGSTRSRNGWKGALCYGDAHCETQAGTAAEGLRYGGNSGNCPDVFGPDHGFDPATGRFTGMLWHGIADLP